MSEQGKRPAEGECEKCGGKVYISHNGCCSTEYTCLACGHFHEVDENQILIDRLTTAETAATEYAKQASELQEEVERLRSQELRNLAISIDEILPVDIQEKWGLEKLNHERNVQHIFMRACCAILELGEEMERLKSLWIEYRNATDEGSSYSILAELFKRFDDAIRGTE